MKAERILHELVQGSTEWHAFRLEHDGASEAAAMLGLSPYVSRSELLRQKATGLMPEVRDGQQGLFDAGHASEAAARPMAEGMLGDALYPATYSFGRMSASVDGITMDELIAFEHKLWNADLAASIKRGELPEAYQPQCQQIMMVTNAEHVLFMVSDGTPENCVHMYVEPDAAWYSQIAKGWAQFNADLAEYQPVEVIPAAVAAPTLALPALSVQVRGEIQVIDNLKVFGERLNAFIEGLDKNPSDDQAFANAEAAIKTLGTAETALEAAKASALAQTASIDEMTRTVALYAGQARTTRLMLEKLVKARKEAIRIEIVQGGKDTFTTFVADLNKQIGKPYLVCAAPDFAGAIKGKKTVASLRDAVDTLLAHSKIAANEQAGKIIINMQSLRELAANHAFLFADTAQLVLKANDDLVALVKMRIAEHKEKETKRIEAEREKIRAEEQAKLQRAEADRIAKEQAAARGSMPDTKGDSSRTGDSAPSVVTSGNERPSGGLSTNIHTSAAAPTRPTDEQIIIAIANAFNVSNSVALEWLFDMDFDGAIERIAA